MSYAVVVGAGGAGSVVAGYLTAAGVPQIGIVDGATVAAESLARQTLYFAPDAGEGKADALAVKLGLLNPSVQVDPFPAFVDDQNAAAIIMGATCVADCSNDDATHRRLNVACLDAGAALVVAHEAGQTGTLLAIRPRATACLECAFPAVDGPLAGTGESGPVAGAIGSLQALILLRLLADSASDVAGVIHRFDGALPGWSVEPVARRLDCVCCS